MLIYVHERCRGGIRIKQINFTARFLSDIQTSIKHTSNDTKVDDNPEKCHITGGTNVSSEKKIEHDGGHIPSRIPRTGKKIYPQRRCVICSENGTPRDTRYFCKGCMESPTLCKRPCFVIYHNNR